MRPADTVYLTDTGLNLCMQCAHKAQHNVLIIEEQVRTGVLDGEQYVLQEGRDDTGKVHTVIERRPAEEPTACDACCAFLAPETR
jgi:hypothetical protein